MVKLSVIVLCYHGDRWIEACVASLENQSLERQRYEIILVDNGGSTPSIHRYENREQIKIVSLKENLGFAGGNNRALSHAKGKILFLVNQDSVLHPECLQKITEAFRNHAEISIITANMQMRYADEIDSLTDSVPEQTGQYQLSCLGYAVYERVEAREPLARVEFVSGNGLGFRASLLDTIGAYLFDARLKSYAEDLDLSIRANQKQVAMYVCHAAILYHFRDEAFAGPPAAMIRKFLHVSSNRILVYYQNLKPALFLKKLPLLLLGVPLKVGRPDSAGSTSPVRLAAGCALLPQVFFEFVVKVFKNRLRPPAP